MFWITSLDAPWPAFAEAFDAVDVGRAIDELVRNDLPDNDHSLYRPVRYSRANRS